MHEGSQWEYAEDPKQPRNQQYECNVKKHLASRPQPSVPPGGCSDALYCGCSEMPGTAGQDDGEYRQEAVIRQNE